MDIKMIGKIGLWLEDPYGDGCRLDVVRFPSEWREAAKRLVFSNEPEFWDEELVQDNYGPMVKDFIKKEKRRKRPILVQQDVFTDDELAEYKELIKYVPPVVKDPDPEERFLLLYEDQDYESGRHYTMTIAVFENEGDAVRYARKKSRSIPKDQPQMPFGNFKIQRVNYWRGE